MGLTWGQVYGVVDRIAEEDQEHAGLPHPVPGLRMTVSKMYGPRFDNFSFELQEEDAISTEDKVYNSWYSWDKNCTVLVCGDEKRRYHLKEYNLAGKRLEFHINTLLATKAWSLDAEMTALSKLMTHVTDQQFKSYFLSGSFIETSKRSGVAYLFRKLRPTVAIREENNGLRVLSVLCLHPIGYYQKSWAGMMCPTDDVIASLLLMRGDEVDFWRKANHHPVYAKEAGI